MITGNFTAESADLREIEVSSIKAGKEYDYLSFNFGRNSLNVWLSPKDLTRVASMLRQAAEQIEAHHAKEKQPLYLVPRVAADSLASAA